MSLLYFPEEEAAARLQDLGEMRAVSLTCLYLCPICKSRGPGPRERGQPLVIGTFLTSVSLGH